MRKCIFLLLALSTAAVAEAQSSKRLSLGAGVSFHDYSDSRFESKSLSFGPRYRLNQGRRGENGWDWDLKTSLSFSRMDVPTEVFGSEVRLGKVRTIPLLVGVGRTYRHGPMKVGAYVTGGPSFNDFEVDEEAVAAYQAGGSDLENVHVKTSAVFKPGVSATYDLSSWLALQGSVSYIIHRPTVRTLVDGVSTSETWKLDHSTAGLGLLVGIF